MIPSTKDGVTIRLMTEEDYGIVKPFVKDNFFGSEPMCASSGEEVHLQNEKENDAYHLCMIAQDTCLVALDEKNGGRLVGVVLAGCQVPQDLEKNRIDAEAMEANFWGRASIFISQIEREANVFERFGISRVLYSHITSADTSMRGKGLGSRLAATLMEVGRSKGFPAMVAYCTSFFSARQKEALGMQCIHSVAYADYKDAQGRAMFTPDAPHTTVRVLAIKL
ncbi:arylalkylamine N-acetyltransferase-like 2 [Drosophila biarmipes]|uniref:arylalkylamine N-acetyltransferase-like 2 n=1 Tax=Drosophila biarmipes TaxID=125945 RepID=UPI0007E5C9CE|nr:arylalkylamine N-acetyltransferase-like 2 [Drosophila biarmipes]